MISIRKTGDWGLVGSLLGTLPVDMARAIDDVSEKMAEDFLAKAKKAFATSGASNNEKWAANTAATLAGKRGGKPLINTGALERSMSLQRRGRGKYTIVFKGQGGVSAKEMQIRASMHEKGGVIAQKVTAKQHKAVMAKLAGKSGGNSSGSGTFKPGSIMVIKIPKRSFLASTKKAHFGDIKLRPRISRNLRMNLVKYKRMMT